MKVLFIVPYPKGEAPSQRFRFEQYLDVLSDNNIQYDFNSFWDEKTWKILYLKGHSVQKIFAFFKGWLRRFLLLFKTGKYDYIFLHREAAPVGPPVIEWILTKLLHKKIIYDFDDAIWLPNTSSSNHFAGSLKWHWKVKSICKWAYKISCGNDYLASFASRYNKSVLVIPTTVDTGYYKPSREPKNGDKIIIGWTGSQSTNFYLQQLVPVFKKLSLMHSFELRIISNQPPSLDIPFTFVKWNKMTEVEDLQPFDIGIMPLPDDKWTKGKCGFKLIQYLSVGIASVASPVGVNPRIIEHNKTGLLAKDPDEWQEALMTLISNLALRTTLGHNGQIKIENEYSKKANSEKYLSLFH